MNEVAPDNDVAGRFAVSGYPSLRRQEWVRVHGDDFAFGRTVVVCAKGHVMLAWRLVLVDMAYRLVAADIEPGMSMESAIRLLHVLPDEHLARDIRLVDFDPAIPLKLLNETANCRSGLFDQSEVGHPKNARYVIRTRDEPVVGQIQLYAVDEPVQMPEQFCADTVFYHCKVRLEAEYLYLRNVLLHGCVLVVPHDS